VIGGERSCSAIWVVAICLQAEVWRGVGTGLRLAGDGWVNGRGHLCRVLGSIAGVAVGALLRAANRHL